LRHRPDGKLSDFHVWVPLKLNETRARYLSAAGVFLQHRSAAIGLVFALPRKAGPFGERVIPIPGQLTSRYWSPRPPCDMYIC
jgi:hypothetical protein